MPPLAPSPPTNPRPPRSALALLALACVAVLGLGCATGGAGAGGTGGGGAGKGQGPGAGGDGVTHGGSEGRSMGQRFGRLFTQSPEGPDPWRLPPGVYPSQRLYRVQYQGPEGKLGFRLTLYLASPRHYRMDAADTLGRRVFSLAVEPDDRAIWIDHRAKLYCLTRGASEQTFVPIAYLPLEALPRLILGRMPARPVGEVLQAEGKISYRDDQGQLWNGLEKDGELAWWSLLRDGEAVAWWRLNGEENIFSDRRGGQQVRWTEQVRETLGEPLASPEVPDTYREGVCGDALERPPA